MERGAAAATAIDINAVVEQIGRYHAALGVERYFISNIG